MSFAGKVTAMLSSAALIYLSHVQPGGLKFFKYFGPKRHAEQQALLDNDIIFTTYGTLASEWTGEQSLLKHITWFRIILDEGIQS